MNIPNQLIIFFENMNEDDSDCEYEFPRYLINDKKKKIEIYLQIVLYLSYVTSFVICGITVYFIRVVVE